MKKRAAIELSIGTIVIIVLAMSMLILGLVLVKNIFTGASDNILQINDKVKDQINKLFVEDKKTVVYLPNQKAEIAQNEDWGIAFAIKNTEKNTNEARRFKYSVELSPNEEVLKKCGVNEKTVLDWIVTGREDTVSIAPGETYYGIARFFIPEGSPLCTIRFHFNVDCTDCAVKDYATDFFDVEITS